MAESWIDYIEENEDWLIQRRMERNHDEANRMENWRSEEVAKITSTNKGLTANLRVTETLKMENCWKNWKPNATRNTRRTETASRMENSSSL